MFVPFINTVIVIIESFIISDFTVVKLIYNILQTFFFIIANDFHWILSTDRMCLALSTFSHSFWTWFASNIIGAKWTNLLECLQSSDGCPRSNWIQRCKISSLGRVEPMYCGWLIHLESLGSAMSHTLLRPTLGESVLRRAQS